MLFVIYIIIGPGTYTCWHTAKNGSKSLLVMVHLTLILCCVSSTSADDPYKYLHHFQENHGTNIVGMTVMDRGVTAVYKGVKLYLTSCISAKRLVWDLLPVALRNGTYQEKKRFPIWEYFGTMSYGMARKYL